MMKNSLRRRLCLLAMLPLAAGLFQCKKQGAPANSGGPRPSGSASLSEAAAKLGFAGKLPATTEFYFGTSELKAHLTELKKSAFWKDVSAVFNDKMPAAAGGDKTFESLQKLWGDDFFIAGGAGFSEAALALRDFNHLNSEMNFRMLMAGSGGKPASGANAGPLKMLDGLFKDPDLLRRAEALAVKLEMPPLIIGIKVEKPGELLKQLITEDTLKNASKAGTLSDLTTPEGFVFKVITFEGRKVLSDKDRADSLAKLPAETTPEVRALADKILADVQSKKIFVAYGVAGDHIILACGKNLDHLKFAPNAAQSLLSKPELACLTPYTAKNLLGIFYAETTTVKALADDQPIAPMVRGLVSAMKGSDMFRELAHKLEGQVGNLAALESKVYTRDCTALVAATWWDKGLHEEVFGGARPRFFRNDGPTQFARLLESPGVLFGMAFNRDKDYEKQARTWAEKLISMVYTAAQDLVQAGVAGKDSGQQFAMFEQNIRPAVEKIYQAGNDMDDRALGSPTAYIIDMKGKMPAMIGMPPEAKGTPIPRLYSISEVSNRPQLAQSWTAMSNAITESTANLTPKGSPVAFTLPDALSSEKNGVTTYFYGLPFLTGDLLPCASVNDRLLIISSSKDGAEALAGELAKPAPTQAEGCVLKLDFDLVSELIKSTAKLGGDANPKSNDGIKQALKWLKPFHTLKSHTYEENGQSRSSISWEITDVLSFD